MPLQSRTDDSKLFRFNIGDEREKILLGLIKGNAIYHREHLKEVASLVKISKVVMTTGGGAKIRGSWRQKSAGQVILSSDIKINPPLGGGTAGSVLPDPKICLSLWRKR